jgi:alpha-glucosidase
LAEWWRDAVLYEIYVRSFADGNGDGLGDLPGIRAHLPYLRDLGVDGIWLTPFYPSPDADHGYDIADYVDVDPRFGTLDDFDALVADAHDLGLRVVIDVVPNHTSDQHPWFRNALSDPDGPDRARYLFRPGRDGGPPNNWTSAFGGSAWRLDEGSGEYYLHVFAPEQPDLDWHNPEVEASFDEILRFWLDRGVDGFRIDVAQGLFKDPSLADMTEPEPRTWHADWVTAVNQPELLPLYGRWHDLVDDYEGERMLVGEIVLKDQEAVAQYVMPGRLHLAFNFTLLHADWDAAAMRETIDATRLALDAVGAPPTWVLENHDVVRLPTRYGGGPGGERRARAAALLLLGLPGTVFLYAGQELGLEEVEIPDEQRQDPIFFRTKGKRRGRDGCRVPIPWESDPPGFGFTDATPWLPIPDGWTEKSVDAEAADPSSTLALYRAALAARRENPALRAGSFAWRDTAPGVLVWERREGDDTVACVVNVDGDPVPLPDGDLLVASDPDVRDTLPPATAAWVRLRR